MPLKGYILVLFSWIKDTFSQRDSIRKSRNTVGIKTIEKFQGCCQLLYHSDIFRSIVSYVYYINNSNVRGYDRILYYLDKVSAHMRSLDLILKCLEQRKLEYGETYKNIQWYFIKPIENIVELNETPSSSFDKIWSACGLPDDQTKVDFKCEYIKDKFDTYDSTLKLSTCLHCEIRIIDYLIENNIHEVRDNDIEIGVAKLSCYPCSLYIEKLNAKYDRNFCVAVLTTRGKIYAKWAFRNNEDEII
ncbi:unnamed protein product [Didymodactylos carnosus]|uniref:Uncharacterized protein n=1 Tax=Didymodactylos carnosus TaxID=1234261 RepID=A0A814ZBG2_9BILA|nr:unnamed protein product [Didymodactylos carnosus]CAF4002376.1 unnamed protein product [Didymodactylos carnosus]